MEAALQVARTSLSQIEEIHLNSLEGNRAAIEEYRVRLRTAEEEHAKLREGDMARKELMNSIESARVDMESELWCIAAALEEKQRLKADNAKLIERLEFELSEAHAAVKGMASEVEALRAPIAPLLLQTPTRAFEVFLSFLTPRDLASFTSANRSLRGRIRMIATSLGPTGAEGGSAPPTPPGGSRSRSVSDAMAGFAKGAAKGAALVMGAISGATGGGGKQDLQRGANNKQLPYGSPPPKGLFWGRAAPAGASGATPPSTPSRGGGEETGGEGGLAAEASPAPASSGGVLGRISSAFSPASPLSASSSSSSSSSSVLGAMQGEGVVSEVQNLRVGIIMAKNKLKEQEQQLGAMASRLADANAKLETQFGVAKFQKDLVEKTEGERDAARVAKEEIGVELARAQEALAYLQRQESKLEDSLEKKEAEAVVAAERYAAQSAALEHAKKQAGESQKSAAVLSAQMSELRGQLRAAEEKWREAETRLRVSQDEAGRAAASAKMEGGGDGGRAASAGGYSESLFKSYEATISALKEEAAARETEHQRALDRQRASMTLESARANAGWSSHTGASATAAAATEGVDGDKDGVKVAELEAALVVLRLEKEEALERLAAAAATSRAVIGPAAEGEGEEGGELAASLAECAHLKGELEAARNALLASENEKSRNIKILSAEVKKLRAQLAAKSSVTPPTNGAAAGGNPF